MFGGKLVIVKFSDGRTVRRSVFPTDPKGIYKILGGVITQKFCAGCEDWLGIESFQIFNRKTGFQDIAHKCTPCSRATFNLWQREKLSKKGIPSRRSPESKFCIIKERIMVGKDGLEYLSCNVCKEEKLLLDFVRNKDFYKPHCRQCKKDYNDKYYAEKRLQKERVVTIKNKPESWQVKDFLLLRKNKKDFA